MKIMVVGHGRHGKDTFCEMLGLPFKSSSEVALEKVIWPVMEDNIFMSDDSPEYFTPEECFKDRHNYRDEWAKLITAYNTPDRTRLAKDIFAENDIYCGIRNRDEFYAIKRAGLFDIAVWVDRSGHLPPEGPSNQMTAMDCDFYIDNNGDMKNLQQQADYFLRYVHPKEDLRQRAMVHLKEEAMKARQYAADRPDVKDLIVNWADEVFPERTITNAIQKMVLEEIPEYLMCQNDPMELADIGILLYDIAHLAGIDLDAAIREKMEINIARTWHIDEATGLMKHDKTKPIHMGAEWKEAGCGGEALVEVKDDSGI